MNSEQAQTSWLKECPACGNLVSKKAAACPACGHDLRMSAPANPKLLKTCAACGHIVSKKAARCIACGHPAKRISDAVLIVILCLIVAFVIAGLASLAQ